MTKKPIPKLEISIFGLLRANATGALAIGVLLLIVIILTAPWLH